MPAKTFKTPDTFYMVARAFSELGFGSGGDLVTDFDEACDQYSEAIRDDDRARVFRIMMDADNQPAGINDMTADAHAVVRDRLFALGYGDDEVNKMLAEAA